MIPDKQTIAAVAETRKRFAVHLNADTWALLRDASIKHGLSMSSLVHFLITERCDAELGEAIAAKPVPRRAKGRPKQSFHGER